MKKRTCKECGSKEVLGEDGTWRHASVFGRVSFHRPTKVIPDKRKRPSRKKVRYDEEE